eukprot:scaffold9627_cov63-Attheya_sp.AAC.6
MWDVISKVKYLLWRASKKLIGNQIITKLNRGSNCVVPHMSGSLVIVQPREEHPMLISPWSYAPTWSKPGHS